MRRAATALKEARRHSHLGARRQKIASYEVSNKFGQSKPPSDPTTSGGGGGGAENSTAVERSTWLINGVIIAAAAMGWIMRRGRSPHHRRAKEDTRGEAEGADAFADSDAVHTQAAAGARSARRCNAALREAQRELAAARGRAASLAAAVAESQAPLRKAADMLRRLAAGQAEPSGAALEDVSNQVNTAETALDKALAVAQKVPRLAANVANELLAAESAGRGALEESLLKQRRNINRAERRERRECGSARPGPAAARGQAGAIPRSQSLPENMDSGLVSPPREGCLEVQSVRSVSPDTGELDPRERRRRHCGRSAIPPAANRLRIRAC
eukprot:TRINITY_DN13901_c0_g1_i1.p1 TRINITY_DN13901_c0_g1~~TRINITY_DN13901_c0_g1_i1.p1  ORF type:complete len:329 (+),score=61.78 TRINITY_DN13901_c0_g1_i1:92-1078(+)